MPGGRHHIAGCKRRQLDYRKEKETTEAQSQQERGRADLAQEDEGPEDAESHRGGEETSQTETSGQEPKRGHRFIGDPPPEEARVKRYQVNVDTQSEDQHMTEELLRCEHGSDAPMTPTAVPVPNSPVGDQRMEQRPPTPDATDEPAAKVPRVDDLVAAVMRSYVNEDPYPLHTIRGLPADQVKKGMERELKDLEQMEVFEWCDEKDVPRGCEILDCGWAMRQKGPGEVRARVVLKDFATTKVDEYYAPTPTSVALRCLMCYAAVKNLKVSTSDVKVAFMHASASEVKYARPPREQRTGGKLWRIKNA